MPEKAAQKEPGKKPVPSKKPKPQQEVVVQIPLSELHPFPDHPFQVRKDASMQETAESVKEYGVLVPALARPRENGGYELIAGHRRKHACELAGLATMPVIVRDIDRDTATIIMVTPKEQGLLLETIDSEQATPSLSQAQRMKKLSQSGELNEDTMLSIMMEQKKPEKNDITLSGEKLRKYFPRSYTPFQIENTIFKLLDAWQKKRQRDQSR